MALSKAYTINKMVIDDKLYERIKVGDKFDFNEGIKDEDFKCHDCGATTGNYHYWGCDAERCPKCHKQLITCECKNVYIDDLEEVSSEQNEIKIPSLLKEDIEKGRIQGIIVKDINRLK